jgi:hypothetical protein
MQIADVPVSVYEFDWIALGSFFNPSNFGFQKSEGVEKSSRISKFPINIF